jgi:hypothetical protein
MPTPNVTPVSGSGNTGIDNSSAFVRDVDPRLYYLEAFKYPLVSTLFTQGTEFYKGENDQLALKGKSIRVKPTKNTKFEHTENEMLKIEFQPTAALTASSSDVTLYIQTGDAQYFLAGMELLLTNANDQTEVVRVSVVGASSLTITRNVGSTGVIALTTADNFYNMGIVRAEDSLSATAIQNKTETLYNYVEFQSASYGNTRIQQAMDNYHGDDYERKKREAVGQMKQKLEIQAWCGVRDVLNSTTNPIYHNGGIIWALKHLYTDVPVHDAGGTLTRSKWEAFLQSLLKYNAMTKYVFCSSPVLSAISGFAADKIRVTDMTLKKFGLVITEYHSTHGMVYLVRQPLFDDIAAFNGMAVGLDLGNISYRPLVNNGEDLSLKSYDDIQENDRAGRKGEWLVVGGFDTMTGKSHAILENANS